MSNQGSLEQQLEQFRDASRKLQLDPLVTPQKLAQLGVPYQTELIDELEQAVYDSPNRADKLIFTGHRGCGKSTLLAELGFRLTEDDRYFVVMFSISDTIEESAVDHVNILFSMAVQMLEAAERRSLKLSSNLRSNLYRWLAKHTKTELNASESEIEVGAKAEAKGGLPGVLSFLAEIKSKLRVNAIVREEITTEFARRISDLIDRINEIQAYIESATGKPVLVMIDDLDKLDLSVTDTIFSKNIKPLLAPNFRIIYTVPIATLRDVSLKRGLESYVNKIHTMRVGKFFSKASVRRTDRTPDARLFQVFETILDRRLPSELVEPDVKYRMILKSGGVLRELIRIADRCCDRAMQELRRQIRRAGTAIASVKIDRQILDRVLNDLQIEFAEPLGQVDFDALKLIYQQLKPISTEEQRFLDLLHGLYILEYRNAVLWYDLNPIVLDLLVQEGVIDDSD